MAEVIFRDLVLKSGLEKRFEVTSAGTGDWHVGEQADPRTLTALAANGYNGQSHRAKQFEPTWFDRLDLIVAFDRSQERTLKSWTMIEADQSKVQLLLEFDKDQAGQVEVPDPYYADAATFEAVLQMIQRACTSLFRQIEPGINRRPT